MKLNQQFVQDTLDKLMDADKEDYAALLTIGSVISTKLSKFRKEISDKEKEKN